MTVFSSAYWGGLWSSLIGKNYYHVDLESNDGIGYDESHNEVAKALNALETNKEVAKLRGNNEYIASFSNAIASGVIGLGTSLQYRLKSKPEINNQVENWLKHWGEIRECEITNRFFREDAERFLAVEFSVMNGVMVRHHWGKNVRNFYQFEILTMDTIDRTKNDLKKKLFSGLQTNDRGQITGAWIYTNTERNKSEFVKAKYLTIAVDTWTSSSQYTNISQLAPVLKILSDLDSYTKAELDDARERAKRSIIIASPLAKEKIDQQKNLIKQYKTTHGETSTQYRQGLDKLNKLLKLYSSYTEHRQANIVAEGTEVTDLKKSSNSIYQELSINTKQVMSKGMGYASSTIAGLIESSYNQALKEAQNDENANAIRGQKIINRLLVHIYRNAIEAGVILGEIDAPDFFTNRREYNMALSITRKQRDHIDPTKQNTAEATALENGTADEITLNAKRNQDWEETLRRRAEYAKRRKEIAAEFGLTPEELSGTNTETAQARQAQENIDIQNETTPQGGN